MNSAIKDASKFNVGESIELPLPLPVKYRKNWKITYKIIKIDSTTGQITLAPMENE